MEKENILNRLKTASYNYYNNLQQTMTDEEYDALYDYASKQGWVNKDTELNDGSEITSKEITRTVPMLSLAKADSLEEIKKYVIKLKEDYNVSSFYIEPKLDGIALEFKYSKDNEIEYLGTRGNGIVGENLTHLIKDNNIKIIGLPVNKDYDSIRGELYLTKTQLSNINKNTDNNFKNERSAISGIITKSKLGLPYQAELTFSAYFATKNGKLVTLDKDFPNQARNIFKDNLAKNIEELETLILNAKSWLDEIDVPTDGIVIKPVEHIEIGSTNHHPKEYIAFKYPTEKKVSIVKDIVYSVGKTGQISPKAILEPVIIDNVEITNATLNNYNWIKSKNIKIGSKVLVTRNKLVIPGIVSVIDNSNAQDLVIPSECQYCHSKIISKKEKLFCSNNHCPKRVQSIIEYIIGKSVLDIDGLSIKTIEQLNLSSVSDLFSLTKAQLSNLKYSDDKVTLGDKRAEKIISNILRARNNTTETKWFISLGIPNLGQSTVKAILEVYSIHDFFKDIKNVDKLSNIKGIGEETIKTIKEYFESAKSILDDLTKINVKFNRETQQTEFKGVVAHTGKVPEGFKNRTEFAKHLENIGWKFSTSVNKNVNYLINNDKLSSSSKNQQAKKLNIPILTWEEFKDK